MLKNELNDRVSVFIDNQRDNVLHENIFILNPFSPFGIWYFGKGATILD